MSDQTTDVVIDFETADAIGLDVAGADDVQLDFDTSGTPFAANYNVLANKPSIEGTVLIGNKTLPQIGVGLITAQDIDKMIYS